MTLGKIIDEGMLEHPKISCLIVRERLELMSHFAFMPSRTMFSNGNSKKDVEIKIHSNINTDITEA